MQVRAARDILVPELPPPLCFAFEPDESPTSSGLSDHLGGLAASEPERLRNQAHAGATYETRESSPDVGRAVVLSSGLGASSQAQEQWCFGTDHELSSARRSSGAAAAQRPSSAVRSLVADAELAPVRSQKGGQAGVGRSTLHRSESATLGGRQHPSKGAWLHAQDSAQSFERVCRPAPADGPGLLPAVVLGKSITRDASGLAHSCFPTVLPLYDKSRRGLSSAHACN